MKLPTIGQPKSEVALVKPKHKFRIVVNAKQDPLVLICDHCQTSWKLRRA